MDGYTPEVERVMTRLFDSLGEKDRRRYAAVEATKLGHGGVEYIAGLFGCGPKTIRQLRRLAAQWLSREQPRQALDATALVHEAYLRVLKKENDGGDGLPFLFERLLSF